jgi:hypothetical protein
MTSVQMVHDGQTHIGSLECVTADRIIAYAIEGGILVKIGEFVDHASPIRALRHQPEAGRLR